MSLSEREEPRVTDAVVPCGEHLDKVTVIKSGSGLGSQGQG